MTLPRNKSSGRSKRGPQRGIDFLSPQIAAFLLSNQQRRTEPVTSKKRLLSTGGACCTNEFGR